MLACVQSPELDKPGILSSLVLMLGFCGKKQLVVLLLPLEGMLVHCRVTYMPTLPDYQESPRYS